MDSKYIINRLKTTPYKFPTVDLLRTRLKNLDEIERSEIVSNLKMEVYRHTNVDIQEPLMELLRRPPLAS